MCKSTLLGMRLVMVCHTIARRIPNNVLLHNTICCHNTLLIYWNYLVNVFKMTLARNNVAPGG